MASLIKINNTTRATKRILLAPLDWGLGHATRCIPVIKELLNTKCEVLVAASGEQRALLQREFPRLTFIELAGYQVKYGKGRLGTLFSVIGSIPKILIRIKYEHRWLARVREEMGIDAVISDNRYGLWCPGLYSVLMTHQLEIRSPMGGFVDQWIRRWHYRLIDKHTVCWVPDEEKGTGLAGQLSHPGVMPRTPVRYVGVLSRMEATEHANKGLEKVTDRRDRRIDILILLSGPESQRSLFEQLVLAELADFAGRAIIVRGLPKGGERLKRDVEHYDHLPAAELNRLLLSADLVVARSGYSTVMDLVRLSKKAVLVPTPGQTEQEYLGEYLMRRGIAVCMPQQKFSLTKALQLASGFSYSPMKEQEGLLRAAVTSLISAISPAGHST